MCINQFLFNLLYGWHTWNKVPCNPCPSGTVNSNMPSKFLPWSLVFYKTLYTSVTMLTKTVNPFETKYPCQLTDLPNLLHKVIMPQPQESVPMTEIHVLMHVFMLIAAIHRHTLMIFYTEGSTYFTYLTTYNEVTESMLNSYTTLIKFIHTTTPCSRILPEVLS